MNPTINILTGLDAFFGETANIRIHNQQRLEKQGEQLELMALTYLIWLKLREQSVPSLALKRDTSKMISV